MNPTHIHLMLNHVSILAALFSVLIYITGTIKKNYSIKNIALTGFVLAAIAAIPVFLTGEPAEESVEHLPGVLESIIDSHEDAAEIALWLIEITGVVALAGLFSQKLKFVTTTTFSILMVVLSLTSSVSISYAGYLGGKIRHTELSSATTGNGIESGQENEEDED